MLLVSTAGSGGLDISGSDPFALVLLGVGLLCLCKAAILPGKVW